MSSIHDFSMPALVGGGTINFADYKGKKILLVNVASFCGLTPQYKQLQEMHELYADRLAIIGCPANNFAAQEPGTDEEIATFCSTTYDVTFPITKKISVKGDDQHPLYQFATQKALNGVQDSEVSWNFQKYLFDENGVLESVIAPRTEPAEIVLFEQA
jgi:glutathione peroxidase